MVGSCFISKPAAAALLATLLVPFAFAGAKHSLPHYVFILPDGYVGWIQVIFSSPNAPEPPLVNNGLVLRIDNSGVFRTRMIGSGFTGSRDEFFYSKMDAQGKETLAPVPSNYVCTEYSGMDFCYDSDSLSDGFTVGRANLGHPNDGTPGDSWFLFVGPPDLRKKYAVPVHLAPGEKYHIDVPKDDPTPGRIRSEN
jgi:hypothetical protein